MLIFLIDIVVAFFIALCRNCKKKNNGQGK